ncbi:MAG: PDZ domain-containing protein [Pseudomonadota bacterium]
MNHNIHYRITPIDPFAHLFEVCMEITLPSEAGHCLALPVWIPGSYMIRDFAKNITQLSATSEGKPLVVNKLDKTTWQFPPTKKTLEVTYQVYAWDLSVRAAHLDQTHGYFNGTSVFLAVVGFEEEPISVTINPPPLEQHNWRIATSLQEKTAKRYGFGEYEAKNYDDLIDHPVEMADFTLATFEACGVPHDVVLVGQHRTDMERLCRDLKIICEYHIRFFGEPAPMARYVFMTYILGEGYGGLEHRASTSLHCKRADLPLVTDKTDEIKPGYRTYLGLCSHEYFHTWNVKRIKPAKFFPYDLTQESYTELLWVFEGFTSYFDDLALVKSGLITADDYLDALAKTITSVWRNPGRLKQHVAESSFDAWTKFYKQDENAPNAIVSYYTKGALIALGLDQYIREQTNHQKSLADVMRLLWVDYGQTQQGIEERAMPSIIKKATGVEVTEFLDNTVYSTDDFPVEMWLEKLGVQCQLRPRKENTDRGGYSTELSALSSLMQPNLGAQFKSHVSGAELAICYTGGSAQKAGLSAGDVIIAVDGLKVTQQNVDSLIRSYSVGETLKVHAFRRDELMVFDVRLLSPQKDTCSLSWLSSGLTEDGKQWLA